jgi:AcrR family transcriptional regulator
MEEKEVKLIQQASAIFMRFGIKSITMDDMARHLGISKKTLYLYVKDKEELVAKVLDSFCKEEDHQIREIRRTAENAIDELLEIGKWVMQTLQNLHPSVTFDMEKYHPESYRKMQADRFAAVYSHIMSNIKKGQKEGYYRKDINPDIITKIYITRMDAMFSNELFPVNEYRLVDVYQEMFRYHIRGIASEKGLEYLQQKSKHLK